jgi:hypothetical protein
LGDDGGDDIVEDCVGGGGSLRGIFLVVVVSTGVEVENGDGFGASFFFFFLGSVSADGEADVLDSSSFRFFGL